MGNVIENANLSYQENGSDKVYIVKLIEESQGKYNVQYAYGRRGSSLATGNKNTSLLAYDKAKKMYDKIIQEKTGKGYQDAGGNTSKIVNTDFESRDTGLRPQLLNEISDEELEEYLINDSWCAQEKYDGKRRMYIKTIGLTEEVKNILKKFHGDIILDGEDMGSYTALFDVLSVPGDYKTRYSVLRSFMSSMGNDCLRLVDTAWNEISKRALLQKLRDENAEGIVFKRIDSLYKPGRPASGGDQIKYKFISTASCIVTNVSETKRSVSIGVYDLEHPESIIDVGNVTVYPNQEIPKIRSIIEVRYLYYFPGGSLFQPRICGSGNVTRDDIDEKDCLLSKLKIKKEEENEDI